MSKYVGTWVYNTAAAVADTVKTLRLDVRDASNVGWGTAVGLGWTPTLEVRLAGDDGTTAPVATITGAWEDGTQSAALFQIGAVTALVPTAPTVSIDYEALMVMTSPTPGSVGVSAADDEAEPFAFTVTRWPA